jgi:hypothetical protein
MERKRERGRNTVQDNVKVRKKLIKIERENNEGIELQNRKRKRKNKQDMQK